MGVDSGGTFTDLVAMSSDTVVRHVKVPSNPSAPVSAVMAALDEAGLDEGVDRLVHGTTVTTNAVLQRTGAAVCLLTTAGFEDIAFIQRLNRRYAFTLDWQKPTPLVSRRHVIGVRERIEASGEVLQALEPAECDRVVEEVSRRFAAGEIEVVAICLLFSYLNGSHEQALAARLTDAIPGLPVSSSNVVSPIWREYERTSTTLADAYVRPLMSRYLTELEVQANRRGPFTLLMLKSNGGTGAPISIRPRPVTTLRSGLAGGAVGGAYFGRLVNEHRCITFDMGGTSTDIGLVINGEVGHVTDYEIEWGLPVAVPVVDVLPIGAGGGSIARVDEGGLVQVGPQSAGADPGPACYARGGSSPTVTDANLVLKRLNSEFFLGGRIKLDEEAAWRSIAELAQAMGAASVIAAAHAIVHIANENMANTIRLVTIEHGIDPRDHCLVAFGGAGPLHACGVAEAVGMRRIVVPPHPGLCSAFGAAIAPLRVDRVWTLGARSDEVDEADVRRQFELAIEEVLAELARDGVIGESILDLRLACRYVGQNYEQDVLVPDLSSRFWNERSGCSMSCTSRLSATPWTPSPSRSSMPASPPGSFVKRARRSPWRRSHLRRQHGGTCSTPMPAPCEPRSSVIGRYRRSAAAPSSSKRSTRPSMSPRPGRSPTPIPAACSSTGWRSSAANRSRDAHDRGQLSA